MNIQVHIVCGVLLALLFTIATSDFLASAGFLSIAVFYSLLPDFARRFCMAKQRLHHPFFAFLFSTPLLFFGSAAFFVGTTAFLLHIALDGRSWEKANMSVTKYYDTIAVNYDTSHSSPCFERLANADFNATAPLTKGKSVLDVGCGTGTLLKRLEDTARSVMGVDISPIMIACAKLKGILVQHCSIIELPFADSSFDVVCCFKVLPHVECPEAALREMMRVARKHVVFSFYNSHSLERAWRVVRPKPVFTRYHSVSSMQHMLPNGLNLIGVWGAKVLTPKGYTIFVCRKEAGGPAPKT